MLPDCSTYLKPPVTQPRTTFKRITFFNARDRNTTLIKARRTMCNLIYLAALKNVPGFGNFRLMSPAIIRGLIFQLLQSRPVLMKNILPSFKFQK